MVTLQWLAFREGVRKSHRLDQRIWSVRKTSRKNKPATTLPQGVTHPSLGPGQLLLVETEIYGLVSDRPCYE